MSKFKKNVFKALKFVIRVDILFVMLILGLGSLLLGTMISSGESKDCLPVEAEIIHIVPIGDTEGSHDFPTVRYVVNGTVYENKLQNKNDGAWKEGDLLKCKYDPEDPNLIYVKGNEIAQGFILFGIMLTAVSMVYLVSGFIKVMKTDW